MTHPYTKYYFMIFKRKYPILQNQTSHAFNVHPLVPSPQNSGKLKMMYFGKCRSKVKVAENDLERSNVAKGQQVTYHWKGNCLLFPTVPRFQKSVDYFSR